MASNLTRNDHPANLRRNLQSLTPARVGLRTAGTSLATTEVLSFQLAHAQARDAVHIGLNAADFGHRLRTELHQEVQSLQSQASTRQHYLRHPEQGRRLSPASAATLASSPCTLAIVIADGLSARAVETNTIPVLTALIPMLRAANWTLAITLVEQGRVAIADEIATLLHAESSLVLIGERPGLTTAASLGAYLTWNPHIGSSDAERNCISNIHPQGLPPQEAAARIFALLQAARARGGSGIALKEGQANAALSS